MTYNSLNMCYFVNYAPELVLHSVAFFTASRQIKYFLFSSIHHFLGHIHILVVLFTGLTVTYVGRLGIHQSDILCEIIVLRTFLNLMWRIILVKHFPY